MKCKHCGLDESEHCPGFELFDIPDGCVCDPMTWWPNDIPLVCENFVGEDTGRYCERCEHDYDCHGRGLDKVAEGL